VLLDCGNGTAGIVAPDVFRRAGHDVDVLFSEPDGRFPNRESELTGDALEKARRKSKGYDITIAYDGDADRIALIDDRGRIVEPELVASLIMSRLLKEQKGDVVANIECSNVIDSTASGFGRKVFRTPVGYAFVIKGIYRNRACFGIEKSMHFCIPHIFPFDDGIAAGLYAAYALSRSEKRLSEMVDGFPSLVKDQVNFDCPDAAKPAVMESIKQKLSGEYQKINDMDGIRVDTGVGWFLIRQSNTSPLIRLTVEAKDEKSLKSMSTRFSAMIREEIRNAARSGPAPHD
jgi:phosphomannomutase